MLNYIISLRVAFGCVLFVLVSRIKRTPSIQSCKKEKKICCGSSNVHNLRRNVKNFEGSSNVMVVAVVDAMVGDCGEG